MNKIKNDRFIQPFHSAQAIILSDQKNDRFELAEVADRRNYKLSQKTCDCFKLVKSPRLRSKNKIWTQILVLSIAQHLLWMIMNIFLIFTVIHHNSTFLEL